jgi:hypothetical protein
MVEIELSQLFRKVAKMCMYKCIVLQVKPPQINQLFDSGPEHRLTFNLVVAQV